MKKLSNNLLLTGILLSSLALVSGCGGGDKSTQASPSPKSPTSKTATTSTPTSSQLKFEKSFLVRKTPDKKVVPVNDGVYKRGEDVQLVLLNVGKFKKGQDGKNWLDMDMEVKNAKGEVILVKKSLIGEKGHTALKDDVAVSPNGTVNTTPKIQPGTYQITLTIYDKVGGGRVTETKPFTLK
ncbi:hypothetical protein [Coleofasciculus sp. H7-2]|uniref:hypothetical protein n=1 Tax=Coleofasciculus sp. H7-2 TaxID=3351545 RepID=UPI00366AE8C4